MLSVKEFSVPTKIHFASRSGADIAAVYVDKAVLYEGGASFYFGKLCVASLSESYFVVGSRQLRCSDLRRVEPFWYDPVEEAEVLPPKRPIRAELLATA